MESIIQDNIMKTSDFQIENLNANRNIKSIASTTIYIPFSSMKKTINYMIESNKIALNTSTTIKSYEITQMGKIAFYIYGKWRDTLQAARLLWYKLIKETAVYVHSSWKSLLELPLKENPDKTMINMYKRVQFTQLDEYNFIEISGPCWDVLKARKEFVKRIQLDKKSNQVSSDQMSYQQSQQNNSKKEMFALRVLNSIKGDINDDINVSDDSTYTLRNSLILKLITGSRIDDVNEEEKEEENSDLNENILNKSKKSLSSIKLYSMNLTKENVLRQQIRDERERQLINEQIKKLIQKEKPSYRDKLLSRNDMFDKINHFDL